MIAGYTRLSVDRDGNKIGYDIQSEAIQQWADAYGYTVLWYKDPDITAADRKIVRPEYERMLGDLKAGVVGGIVVWRIDRLVRLPREFERCFGFVEDAGGFIADCDQGFDSRKDMGKAIMRIIVIVSDLEISSMRVRQLAHQNAKAELGQYKGGGSRAFGFEGAIRNAKKQITNKGRIGVAHIPDEVALLKDAAKRIAWDGETYADVCRAWANRSPPVVGTRGKLWEVGQLSDVLTGYRTAGLRVTEVEDEETGEFQVMEHKAEWEPILDRKTWEQLRAMRKVRPVSNSREADYLLIGGLAVCGRCGYRCTGATRPKYKGSGVRITTYRCDSTMKAKRNGACSGVSIDSKAVELTVLAQLFTRLQGNPELFEAIDAEETDLAQAELNVALKELLTCEAELEVVGKRQYLPEGHEDRLGESEARGARSALTTRKAVAQFVVDRFSRSASHPTPRGRDRDDLQAWFDALSTLSQKRAWLRSRIDKVVILPARQGLKRFDPDRVSILFADAKNVR